MGLLTLLDHRKNAAHPLLSLVSAGGVLIDGTYSRFFKQGDGSEVCTTSGTDAVGYIEDISGNENHFVQSTAGLKGTYYVENGIKFVDAGPVDAAGQPRFLRSTATLGPESAWHLFTVSVPRVVGGAGIARDYTVFCRNGGAAWPGTKETVFFSGSGDPITSRQCYWDTFGGLAGQGGLYNGAQAVEFYYGSGQIYGRATTDAGKTTWQAPIPDGEAVNSATVPNDHYLQIGFDEVLSQYGTRLCFLLLTKAGISAGDRNTIRSYMSDTFGAWTGA